MRGRRAISWLLAIAVLSFVVWVVPLRDTCWDPGAPRSTRAAVTWTHEGCVLHLRSGDVRFGASQCGSLKCEPGVVGTLEHTRPFALGLLLIVYAVSTVAWAGRWRALLGFAGINLSVMQVWRISIEAQAGGILLPGGIGGDALRVAHVLSRPERSGEVRAPASIVIASVLLDRLIGLALIAGVAAAVGAAFRSAIAGAASVALLVALAAIPVAVVAGLFFLRSAAFDGLMGPQGAAPSGAGRVLRSVAPILAYVRDPRAPAAMALAAALSVVVAAGQFVVVRGLVGAVGATPTDERWIFVGTAMAFIVSAVPALPGAWGTADAAYVFFFGLAGIAPAAALAVCMLYRLIWYLSGMVGAVLSLVRSSGMFQRVPAGSVGKP